MAGPYYVDPAAGGDNDGSDWTHAWVSVQSAFDTATAGETVYCRGTQTLGAVIDVDTNSGDTTSGNIHFIGCDAGGTARAGQFTLDGDEAVANALLFGAVNYITIENFTIVDTTNDGIDFGSALVTYVDFIKCIAESCGGCGFMLYKSYYCKVISCIARNNDDEGFYYPYINVYFINCLAYGNGGFGFCNIYNYNVLYGCLAYENGDDGFHFSHRSNCMINCVSADNNTGATGSGLRIIAGGNQLIINCRFTNNDSYGIEMDAAVDDSNYEDYNVFYDNDDNPRLNINSGLNSDDNPADNGFVDSATDDYNVKTGAEIRSTAIKLNWG